MADGPTTPVHVLAALERLNRRADAFMRRYLPRDVTGIRGSYGRILDLIEDDGSRPSELVGGAWITKQAIPSGGVNSPTSTPITVITPNHILTSDGMAPV